MKTTFAMKPVEKSGAIESIGYDAGTKTLAVQFRGGRPPYHYADVPDDVHAALMGADSIGSHFALYIKPNFDLVAAESASTP